MSRAARVRRGAIAGVGVALAAWAGYALIVLAGWQSSRAAFDAGAYHLVVIEGFARTWPAADVSDYLSATTPGYHWLLAAAARAGASTTGLELIGALVAAAMVGVLGWWSVRVSRWGPGWLAALPLAASVYVVHAATSVLPDNAGWLCVLGVLLLCLRPPRGLGWIVVGAVLLALVLFRQSHAWAAGVLVAAGWLGVSGALLPRRDRFTADASRKLAGAAAGALAALPAVVALAIFVWIWGGLVPPTFAGQAGSEHPNVQSQLSLVAPGFILMLVGLYAPFFAGWWWGGLRASPRRALVFAVVGGAVGLGLALVGPSTFSLEAGREGGFWRIIRAGPVVGGRTSVVLVALSVLGGVMAGACGSALPARQRWLLLIALGGFAAAQVVNANTWQRYYEPFVLMLLGAASALCVRGERAGDGADETLGPLPEPALVRLWRVAGPVLLTLGLAGLTATTLLGEG